MTHLFTASSSSSRFCCICGQELSDAASKEVGIGPICRKMTNEALAVSIPADAPAALAVVSAISVESLPESVKATFALVAGALAEGGNDWRTTINRICFILSWGVPAAAREALLKVVTLLGYIGTAVLLAGEGSSTPASIKALGGRIYAFTPKNKAFTGALKAACPGAKFHPKSPAAPASWSVPVTYAAACWRTVKLYFPLSTGDFAAVLTEALGQGVTALPEAPKPAPVPPKVVLTPVKPGWVAVKSPYCADFVTELKGSLPYGTRYWNTNDKVWEVASAQIPALKALVAKHYGVTL